MQRALRACRSGDEPLKVTLVLQRGRLSPMYLDGVPPNPGDPLHRCVRDVLSKVALTPGATSRIYNLDL